MKIGKKLIIGYSAAALMVGAIGYLGNGVTKAVKEGFNDVIDRTIPMITALTGLRYAGSKLVSSTSEFGCFGTEKEEEKLIEFRKGLYVYAFKQYEDLANRIFPGNNDRIFPGNNELLENIRKDVTTLQQASAQLIDLKRKKIAGLEYLEKKELVERGEKAFLKTTDTAISSVVEEFLNSRGELDFELAVATNLIVASTVICLFMALVIGTFISRSVSNPIKKIESAITDVGRGNLEVKIEIDQQDELGALAKSFNQMIKELKDFREKTITAKEYTNSILKAIADTLIVVNKGHTIEAVNQATLKLLGYSEEELIGQSLGKVFPEEKILILETFLEKDRFENLETLYKAKDGKSIPVLFSASVTRDQNGNIVNLVCTARDITERKLLESSIIKSQRQLRTLSSGLLAAQEQERKRISRELHDDLGQILTAILLNVTRAIKLEIPCESGIYTLIDEIKAGTDEALRRVRGLSANLRPGVLDHLGLKSAVVSFLEEFRERTGLNIVEKIQMDYDDISETVTIAIYRILQEATTNIVKHSAAKKTIVNLQSDQDKVKLTVTDDGQGFKPESLSMDQGLGLLGMRERTEWLGGVFKITSAPGCGTTIHVEIPFSVKTM